MKFREGFVTNSSSTNFLIISKAKLTPEYLFERLGFKKESPLADAGMELCRNILDATLTASMHRPEEASLEYILENFGEKSANLFTRLSEKGFHTYTGRTGSDQGFLTVYFTMDFFEIDEGDFYINGLNCIW